MLNDRCESTYGNLRAIRQIVLMQLTPAITGPPETRSPLANNVIGGYVCIALFCTVNYTTMTETPNGISSVVNNLSAV